LFMPTPTIALVGPPHLQKGEVGIFRLMIGSTGMSVSSIKWDWADGNTTTGTTTTTTHNFTYTGTYGVKANVTFSNGISVLSNTYTVNVDAVATKNDFTIGVTPVMALFVPATATVKITYMSDDIRYQMTYVNLLAGETTNLTIYWGDGTSNTYEPTAFTEISEASNFTHQYTSGGRSYSIVAEIQREPLIGNTEHYYSNMVQFTIKNNITASEGSETGTGTTTDKITGLGTILNDVFGVDEDGNPGGTMWIFWIVIAFAVAFGLMGLRIPFLFGLIGGFIVSGVAILALWPAMIGPLMLSVVVDIMLMIAVVKLGGGGGGQPQGGGRF